jgi:aspartate carbamoyltransferase
MSEINVAPSINGDFENKPFVSIHQLDLDSIEILFDEAVAMKRIHEKQRGINLLPFSQVGAIFYEPSSRTYESYVAAAQRIGAGVISVTNPQFSSHSKGESFGDDISTHAVYSEAIVLRHPKSGAALEALQYSDKPIINAGDGTGEHPSQASLDALTIKQKLGGIDGKTITAVGDLYHGRTVKSLARLAVLYDDVTFNFVAPEELQMPNSIVAELRNKGAEVNLFTDLEEPLRSTDVLYALRLQRERLEIPEDSDIGNVILNRINKVKEFGTEEQKRLLVPGFEEQVRNMVDEIRLLDVESQAYKKLYADLYALRYCVPDVKIIQTNTSPTDNPYVITPELLQLAKEKMILMHPFPRVGEVDIRCDSDPRAVYKTDQMVNGMYIRMAQLALIMGKSVRKNELI